MSTQAVTHVSSRINLVQISHLLIAAGLGSALMFGIDALTFKHLFSENETFESQMSRQELRVKGLESNLKSKDDELSKAFSEKQALNQEIQKLANDIEVANGKVQNLEVQLNSTVGELTKVQQDNAVLSTNAETLSQCVVDTEVLLGSVSNLPTIATGLVLKRPSLALAGAGAQSVAVQEYYNSWTGGNCQNARNIADQYAPN